MRPRVSPPTLYSHRRLTLTLVLPDIYCVADIFAIVVAAGSHTLLSHLFPDHKTLIAEAVFADDVLDGRVPGYEHLARKGSATGSLTPSADKVEHDAGVHPVEI